MWLETNDTNLWVQTLKHFVRRNDLEKIKEILDYIKNVDSLSPLLILNILSQENSIKFSVVKDYFRKKFETNQEAITKAKKDIKETVEQIEKSRRKFKILKTKA